MQAEIFLLSNIYQSGFGELVQKEFELFGFSGIKGHRIEPTRTDIQRALAQAIKDYNVIMFIGGVGEKDADLTVSAVSAAVGFQTVMKNGEIFPEGAEIFRNKSGKPSGCAISAGNQSIIILPGDADSFGFLLGYRVAPYLLRFIGNGGLLRTLRTSGVTLEKVEEAASDAGAFGAAALAFADGDEVAVQIFAPGTTPKEAKDRCNNVIRNMVEDLGDAVYAVDAENIQEAFAKELRKKDLKVAMAVEGLPRTEIIGTVGVGDFMDHYLGTAQGVDRYDLPEKLLNRHGRNSEWTSAVMAGEVAKQYGSTIGLAVTADPAKPENGAYIAVSMGDNVWTEKVLAKDRFELIEKAGKRMIYLARAVTATYPKVKENAVSLKNAVSGKEKFRSTVSGREKQKWYAKIFPVKSDSTGEKIRKSVFILCVLVFLGSMGYLASKMVIQPMIQRGLSANLQNLFTENTDTPDEWEYLPSLYKLYQENEDLVGYIKVENVAEAEESDLSKGYPVVQTEKAGSKGETGQYYLRKDYYGEYSMYGTPFLDYRCDIVPETMSRNLIVYGHNIYDDGKMFADFVKYRKLSYYKKHPIIEFDTLYGENQWLVVGIVLTNAYAKDGPIWDYNNFIDGDEAETKEFLREIARRTMVVTGVDYTVEDHFLTISTCCYDFTDARFVVVARQVREGEDISAFDPQKAYYNANPVMPDKWYVAVSQAQQSEADASFGEPEEVIREEEPPTEEPGEPEVPEEPGEPEVPEEPSEPEVPEESSSDEGSGSPSSSSSKPESTSASSSKPESSTSSSKSETSPSSSSSSSSTSSSKSETPPSSSSSSKSSSSSSSSSSKSETPPSSSSSKPESSQSSEDSRGRQPESSQSPSSSEEPIPLKKSTQAPANLSSGNSYYEQSLSDTAVVNGVSMSVYDAVCQIVTYEAGFGQPDEHVKAQAVATYTYLRNGGCNVSTGVKTNVSDQIRRCVAEVIGYAVLDDRSNDYILATYYSESCGVSAAAEWVWGYVNRNLLSVPSPVDGKEEREMRISSSDFASKVYSKAGIDLDGDPADWISIKSTFGDTDYVDKINLGRTTYSARKLRETILGGSTLRSTAFTVRYDSNTDEFVFVTRGYGHGVGLSAKGSIEYAKMGYSWDEILMKYYSNCYIGTKY